jgi:aryl-alcohol dehydrogenase-like predicted oxidoreductase
MKKRKLGESGLDVFPLAFGGNVFGWTADESMSFRLLDEFVDSGFNLVDTADVYGKWVPGNHGGESETIIGKWLKRTGNRAKVIIATKVGVEMGSDRKGLSARYIKVAVEDSLRRLQTDYIDLYQSHIDDEDTPLDETLATYDNLVSEGKVRAIGASNYSADRLREALEVSRQGGYPRYETLQPQYNLYDRAEYENQMEALCLEKGLGVISYFSLASGFLTGKYRSEKDAAKSPRGERASKMLAERGFRILKALDHVSEERGVGLATISLAWLMHRSSITAPIASATNLEQLHELMLAPELALEQSEIDLLDGASDY